MSSPEGDPLAGLTAARVADTLDLLGHRSRVMDAAVVALRPAMRAVGRAATVAFEPTETADDVDPYGPMIGFLDGLTPGSVAVVAAGGSTRSAAWGELFSAAARGHGSAGVVCDGYLRDVEDVAALGLPAFSLGSRPVDYRARLRVSSVGEQVVCAGVAVAPGDLVVADEDGVVVAPRAVADEVVRLALERAGAESTVLDELVAGASLREVWDRHRVL